MLLPDIRLPSLGSSSDPQEESPFPSSISSLWSWSSFEIKLLMLNGSSLLTFPPSSVCLNLSKGKSRSSGILIPVYTRIVRHRSFPTCCRSSLVKCLSLYGPCSLPQNDASRVKMFGILRFLNNTTLAVDSLDFWTPNLE